MEHRMTYDAGGNHQRSFLLRLIEADNLPPEVSAGLSASVATIDHLKQNADPLYRTAPTRTAGDGIVQWGDVVLINTSQDWDRFVLTLDLHPLPSARSLEASKEQRGRWFIDVPLALVRLEKGEEVRFRLPMRLNRRYDFDQIPLNARGRPASSSEEEDDDDEGLGVHLRIGVKPLNFASYPTTDQDDPPSEVDETLEAFRAAQMHSSQEEVPVRKDKEKIGDKDLASGLDVPHEEKEARRIRIHKRECNDDSDRSAETDTDSEISETDSDEEGESNEEEQEEQLLKENELKKHVEKLHAGGTFILVTRKNGPRPSRVRLSSDQRTIICRRHTILLDSVDELREGQATAEFELHRQPGKEHLSFSLIYNLRRAFNLIAESEEQYRLWVTTLRSLIKKEVDEESAYAERVWHQFGQKSELAAEEVSRLMRKLNMRPTKSYAEEMLRIVDTNNDGHLQYDEFLQLLRLLRQRAEFHELFAKYATNGEYLTPRQFHRFLQREQKEDVSLNQCMIIMKKFAGECKDIDIALDALLPSSSAFCSPNRRERLLRLLKQIILHFPSFVAHTARRIKRQRRPEDADADQTNDEEDETDESSPDTTEDAIDENTNKAAEVMKDSTTADEAAAESTEKTTTSKVSASTKEPARPAERLRPPMLQRKRQGSIVNFWDEWAAKKEQEDKIEARKDNATATNAAAESKGITMNRWQFFQYMISDHNSAFIPKRRKLYQDMNRPLTDYYIASSHNTYLTGNQLKSKSATEMYVLALKQGCRCLELDCWDGKQGYPIVYHGHTLTSRVRFEDAVGAIAKYAFFASPYPLVLSLEVHCSKPQQIMMADMMKNAFGDMLALPFEDSEHDLLPSPEELKCKILLKGSPVRLRAEETEQEEHQDRKAGKRTKEKVAQELSDILYLKSIHFDDFRQMAQEKCNRMTSLAEMRGFKLIASAAPDLVALNRQKFTRIYPKGTRFASTNYDPVPFWNTGCQLVALNYQHVGKKMFYNHGKFLENGQCGYVLKPPMLRSDCKKRYDPKHSHPSTSNVRRLTVRVINARQLPHVSRFLNPYAVVTVNGVEKDARAFRTRVVRNNGFDPQWNQTFDFPITTSELAILLIAIYAKRERFAKDRLVCYYSIPVECIRAGYRVLHMYDRRGRRIPMSNLLCHFTIKQAVLPNMANVAKLPSTLTLPRLPTSWNLKRGSSTTRLKDEKKQTA